LQFEDLRLSLRIQKTADPFMPETLELFDYASLDKDTSVFLQEKTAEVKALMRQTVENVIRTGNILIEVKNRLPHGQWENWLNSEFGWAPRTARRMMMVADEFTSDTLTNLEITTSALYILSAPSTPKETREEAISLAQGGEKVTEAVVKDLRDRLVTKTGDSKSKKQPLSEPKTTTQKTLNFEAP
jgi:5-methylcytosine-specific restriction endonuclease McrBC regulatory subunit McrC